MSSCCERTEIKVREMNVTVPEGHRYLIHIVYCKHCGSEKSTTYIEHVK